MTLKLRYKKVKQRAAITVRTISSTPTTMKRNNEKYSGGLKENNNITAYFEASKHHFTIRIYYDESVSGVIFLNIYTH